MIERFKSWIETAPWDEWIEAHENHILAALVLFIAAVYVTMRVVYEAMP